MAKNGQKWSKKGLKWPKKGILAKNGIQKLTQKWSKKWSKKGQKTCFFRVEFGDRYVINFFDGFPTFFGPKTGTEKTEKSQKRCFFAEIT